MYRLCRGQLERVLGGPLQAVKELEAAWRSSLVGQREVLARKSTAVGKLVQVRRGNVDGGGPGSGREGRGKRTKGMGVKAGGCLGRCW